MAEHPRRANKKKAVFIKNSAVIDHHADDVQSIKDVREHFLQTFRVFNTAVHALQCKSLNQHERVVHSATCLNSQPMLQDLLKTRRQELSEENVLAVLREHPGLWLDIVKLFRGMPLDQDGQELEVRQVRRAVSQ